jgi:acyl-CoA-binding protein
VRFCVLSSINQSIPQKTKSIIPSSTMTEVTKEQFDAIAAVVGDKGTKPKRTATYSEKTKIYGLFKRATVGKLLPPFDDDDVDTDKRPKSRPGMLQIEARAKYDAWQALQDTTKAEAMSEYVKLAEDTVGQPVTDILQG